MSTITNSMFESIKSALTKDDNNSLFKDYLKLEAGQTYTVRLLPNVKDPAKTFFHYYTFGWPSFVDGKYVSTVSPTTWNLRCPINEERYRVYKHGDDKEKEKVASIRRVENWLINIYVINDPVTPENNGKIKVLRFGKQIHKIIMEAIEGEDAEELGSKIFDLSGEGVNFKLKVEQQGEYPSYTSSKFTTPREIEGLSKSDIDKTYAGINDLEKYITVKSYDEIKQLLDRHYFGKEDEFLPAEDVAEVAETKTEAATTVSPSEDDEVNDLLKDL